MGVGRSTSRVRQRKSSPAATWGSGAEGAEDDLNDATKMKIKDAALTLVYRLRFEVMPRLEWVEAVPETDIRLIDLVWRAERLGAGFGQEAPALAAQLPSSHPWQPRW